MFAYLRDLQSSTPSKRLADNARHPSTAALWREEVCVCVRENIAFKQTWPLPLCPNCQTGKQMATKATSPWSHTHTYKHTHLIRILQFNISPQVMNYIMQHYCIGPLFWMQAASSNISSSLKCVWEQGSFEDVDFFFVTSLRLHIPVTLQGCPSSLPHSHYMQE